MITYHVRSRSIVDVYRDLVDEKLILAPYFQRKLVWRLAHKADFIRTILLGFPFPEIFISRGKIDLEKMSSVAAVVDGQQRLSSIKEFIENQFEVDGKKYADLEIVQQESFLKYEIAVIDLDLSSDDQKVVEIFKRLNRTFYALSAIEKMATEYGSVGVMLTAKLLVGEFREEESLTNIMPDRSHTDPNVSSEFVSWANGKKVSGFQEYILESDLFSGYEISRQVHLMHTLNLMATMKKGYYNRNNGAKDLLNMQDEGEGSWAELGNIVDDMEWAAKYIQKLKPVPANFWFTKSNAFTLFCEVCKSRDALEKIKLKDLKEALKDFAASEIPAYRLAAKEGVNNKKERMLRGEAVAELFNKLQR